MIRKNLISLFLFISLITLGIANLHAQRELPIGSIAPNINASTYKGEQFSLEEAVKQGPVVLVFYRGQWCPHCNRHMSALQDSLNQITALGGQVIAITPEMPDRIEKTVNKTDASFRIIYDENHKIMDDYEVTFKLQGGKNFIYTLGGININKANGNNDRVLPVPATYIIGKGKSIKGSYFNEDYSKRMPVRDIIDILRSL